jgi:hypothetical protein
MRYLLLALSLSFTLDPVCAMPVAAQSSRPSAPVVSRDLEALPPQVRRMRSLIVDAARSGDAQAFRRPIETNEVPPSFERERSVGPRTPANVVPAMADALIKLLRAQSTDGEGRATMAAMLNMLAVGYAITGQETRQGTRQEMQKGMYVWPYFAALDPRTLTSEQLVDVHRVLAQHEVAAWREKGRYPHWRLGIGPDGTWHYFHGAERP